MHQGNTLRKRIDVALQGLQAQQFYGLLELGTTPSPFPLQSMLRQLYLYASSCIVCLTSILNLQLGECFLQ